MVCGVALSASAATVPLRLYEIVTETGMPHLEENLRYAVTRQQRCLDDRDLATAFPLLHHPSLADCSLQPSGSESDSMSYALVCTGQHGTTGGATWEITPQLIHGMLQVRMGGKNMKFYQRITARPMGDCDGADTSRAQSRPQVTR